MHFERKNNNFLCGWDKPNLFSKFETCGCSRAISAVTLLTEMALLIQQAFTFEAFRRETSQTTGIINGEFSLWLPPKVDLSGLPTCENSLLTFSGTDA